MGKRTDWRKRGLFKGDNMKNYIVKFDDNYADEFDMEGFRLFKAESEDAIKDSLVDERVTFPCERYFGTNEAMDYDSKEQYFNAISIVEISEEEFNIISKYFPRGFGTFLTLDY